MLGEARDYVRALRARNAALRGPRAEVEASFRGPLVRAGRASSSAAGTSSPELAPRVRAAFAEISGPAAPEARPRLPGRGGRAAEGAEEELAARPRASALGSGWSATGTGATPRPARTPTTSRSRSTAAARGSTAARGSSARWCSRSRSPRLRTSGRRWAGRPCSCSTTSRRSSIPAKNRFLLAYLASLPAQAFLTSTDRRLIEPAAGPETAYYKVESGVVSALFS